MNDDQVDASVSAPEMAAHLSCSDCAPLAVGMIADLIFSILILLPTEEVLRLKSVCRAWAQLISDPLLIRAHCSRPASITSFFTKTIPGFKPWLTTSKLPSMIPMLLSNGFEAETTSHGLVCFLRLKDGVRIVANPATSHWALIPTCDDCDHDSGYCYSHTLIYDPAVSFHFKLTITKCSMYFFPKVPLRFHIYSSETSSWTLSYVHYSHGDLARYQRIDLFSCKASKIGGGSVCWISCYDNRRCLSGYEIANDNYWMTLLPARCTDENRGTLMARNGEIYYASFYFQKKKVKVERLDGDKTWVLEGECDTGELDQELMRSCFKANYDCARKALIIGTNKRDETVALHLSSSRVELLKFDYGVVIHPHPHPHPHPHANTLAPFHGGKQDTQALGQLLHASLD